MEPAWSLGRTTTFNIGGGAFLEIHTDQGLVGLGPEFSPDLLSDVKEYLVGKDPFETQQHFTNLLPLPQSIQYRGITCVSIALWDLIGKACGQPLYKLWGGGKDRVPAYASMIILSTPEERADMAVQLAEEGWQAIKLRLHHESMKEDVRTVELVRKAIGDRMKIMVDPNQATVRGGYVQWDYDRALQTARAIREYDVYWLEEPLPRTDLEGLARLNREADIPIAGAEGDRNLDDFALMMRNDVFDYINPEVLLMGVDNIRKVVAMAELFGVGAVPHNGNYRIGTIAHLHLIASWPNAPYIEVLHDPPIGAYQNHYAIFTNPPMIEKDGCQPVPQGPGLGIEMNPDLIEKG
ncbi:mandelate racemase/muconate lactonizing enzyme family protein [Candidatus Latescibacterota bacterium]